MYARISTTVVTDSAVENPGTKLRTWADSIYYNPMYDTIRAQTADRPGFIYNTHSLVVYKKTAKLVSQIVFDTKENFDTYAADPQTVSICELVESLSREEGLNLSFVDTDQFLHF